MRTRAKAEGRPVLYDGRWRDRDPSEAPRGVPPVVRFRAPRMGETVIEDRVQGTVRVANAQLDDMVMLRADGVPTYMLAVVVDDHDMGVSHVIRGSDHLTNAARQSHLYRALGWPPPVFAHVPLIHGADGARLSKRHGALGLGDYRAMGYLPEAMRNYLLRLGWSHGDDEIISTEQAVEWFDLDAVGRSPARFDLERLQSLNGHYLREADDDGLTQLVAERYAEGAGQRPDERALDHLRRGMTSLKLRAKTLEELTENSSVYLENCPLELTPEAAKLLDGEGGARLARLASVLAETESWDRQALEAVARAFAEREGVKLGKIAQPLRAALTGATVSPGIFEVMVILGRSESLARVYDVVK